MKTKKKVSILGSTGFIGQYSIEVVLANKDKFEIVHLAAKSNTGKILSQIYEIRPKYFVISCIHTFEEVIKITSSKSYIKTDIIFGYEKNINIIKNEEIDKIINAISGFEGVEITLGVLKLNKKIILANKESVLIAKDLLSKSNIENIIPIDSEHSSLFFLMQNINRKNIKSIYITASGGCLSDTSKDKFNKITAKDIIQHPIWPMGKKITIDSSTMLNKGFEVMEANILFDIDYTNIKVVIHKESVVHSMIETIDGMIFSCIYNSDMRGPILNALHYPILTYNKYNNINIYQVGQLNFKRVRYEDFPLLDLCYMVGKTGGLLPCILNSISEVVVNSFLNKRIKYLDMENIIIKMINDSKKDSEIVKPKTINLDILKDINNIYKSKTDDIINSMYT